MIWLPSEPQASACRADSMAEVISASLHHGAPPTAGRGGCWRPSTAPAALGPGAAPVDTDAHGLVPADRGLNIWANCLSFLSPLPTLPGLIRYLDRASGTGRKFRQQAMAVVMEVPHQRHVLPHAVELLADVGHGLRSLGVFTVMRTNRNLPGPAP